MYWGQVTVALVAAIIGVSLVLQSGFADIEAGLVGVVVFVGVRWVVTWVMRVRYWFGRSSRFHARSCPGCEGCIYRQADDWVLQCKRCGWTAGWPVVRWVTRSVPARQLRRTVVGPSLVVVVIAVVIVSSGAVAGLSIADVGTAVTDGFVSGDDEEAPSETLTGNDEVRDAARGYDKTQVREAFVTYLNDEREERGLQELTLRSELTEMGESHAANMAAHDYVGHEWPDGTTIQDRYQKRGLLPECRLDIEGSNRYYAGAENAAGAWVDRRFTSSGGSYHVTNEDELGEAVFEIWMNSEGHREAMLVRSASEMGLGLNITSNGQVYAALELC